MDPKDIYQPQIPRQDRYAARAHRAERWAGWVKLALVATVLAAIWQDKALAPPVHDQMQRVAGLAASTLDRSDTVQAYLSMATTSLPSTTDGDIDPVSKLVRDLRQ